MRLSQDELLLIAYFRTLDGSRRAHLIATAHQSIDAPTAAAKDRDASTCRVIHFRGAPPPTPSPIPPRRVTTLPPPPGTPMFLTNANGSCTYVNQAYAANLGVPAGRCLGFGWVDFVHPDDRAELLGAWQRTVVRPEIPFCKPYRLVIGTRILSVTATAEPFRDRRGRMIGFCGTVVPIHASGEFDNTATGTDPQ